MTGIWEFDDVEGLESFIINLFQEAKESLIEDDVDISDSAGLISLERIVIVDEWGDGDATVGQDQLSMILFMDMEGVSQPSLDPQFQQVSRSITQRMVSMVQDEEIPTPPDNAREWFLGLTFSPAPIDRLDDIVNLQLGRSDQNTVFDLTAKILIQFSEGVSFENLPRTPLDILLEEGVEEEVTEGVPPVSFPIEPVSQPPVLIQPEVVERTRAQRLADLFPEIPEHLREFAVSDEKLEIPAGKETRSVEPRELYDFELRMGLPSQELAEFDRFGPGDQLTDGIGFAAELGRLGTSEPPATFPRTSSYVKNRLLFEGAAYVLELYRDLVMYSGFISGFYNMKLRPGTYQSLRQFINRLNLIAERDGPVLIEPLTQQQAASMGLETLPDHPSIPGEKAPWLQRRQYYGIVEENTGHEAWDNPTEYLYEELGVPEQ